LTLELRNLAKIGNLHGYVFPNKYLAVGNVVSELQDNEEALLSHGL
jgi:hypothetical protein